MEFFEFMLSGPGWGWRALVGVIALNIIMDGVVAVIEAVTSVIKRANYEFEDDHHENDESASKGGGATVDDVRS